MFDDPFFRSYHDHRHLSPEKISVPIHFFSSDQPKTPSPVSNQSAALKIQSIFRGFLVRKSVKNISSIRNEVRKLETSINDTETVELIRLDAKERLRVNETLMTLLFKLDSIRGVDYGIRELRKAVIRKAIALQEKVDSFVSTNNRTIETDREIVHKFTSDQAPESSSIHHQFVDMDPLIDTDCVIDSTTEVANKRSSETEFETVYKFTSDQVLDRSMTNADGVIDVKTEVENSEIEGEGLGDKRKSVGILEKLMDDNEKMMKLMREIFERNELQTRMLNSLSQRVEELEKGFGGDEARKKKKKKRCSV